MIYLNEAENQEDAIIKCRKLQKHFSGQWFIKHRGKFLYFGSSLEKAEIRLLLWTITGIYAKKHQLLDFCFQYISKVGYETFDEAYAAAWTLQSVHPCRLIEDIGEWMQMQQEFFEAAEGSRVYLIQDNEGDVKIGHSKNVSDRIERLQVSHKHPLILICSLPGGEPHERDLHRRFKQSRIRGEWFKRCEEIEKFISFTSSINLNVCKE